jgi:hypothetical protein
MAPSNRTRPSALLPPPAPSRPDRPGVGVALALALGLALLGSGRAAADEVNDAEHDRIADEMEKLAQRQIWSGVERKYEDLVKLNCKLTEEDYLHGAYAARELGDVMAAYARLKAAAKINGTKEIVDWLWDIDNNYGQVELVSVPARSAVLDGGELPFDPNKRKAVEAAIKSSKIDGIFVGMLPKGEYSFAGQRFTVEPGISVRIEVSPKMRRQGLIDPVIVYREMPGSVVGTGGTAVAPPAPPPPDPPPSDDAPTPDPGNK